MMLEPDAVADDSPPVVSSAGAAQLSALFKQSGIDLDKKELFIRQQLLLDKQMGLEPLIHARHSRVRPIVQNANGLRFSIGRGLAGSCLIRTARLFGVFSVIV